MEKMDSKEKVELILAIKQLMEEGDDGDNNNNNNHFKRTRNKTSPPSSGENETRSFAGVSDDDDEEDDDDDNSLLLSRWLSQLETLKTDGRLKQPEPSIVVEKVPSPAVYKVELRNDAAKKETDGGSSENGSEEIVRELRKIKRQNFITHCLLSALIVLTVAWQLSEVSLILKVKNSVSNPFKSLRSMITGMLKGSNTKEERENESSAKQKLIEASSLPDLKIPEMPQMELPVLDFSAGDN